MDHVDVIKDSVQQTNYALAFVAIRSYQALRGTDSFKHVEKKGGQLLQTVLRSTITINTRDVSDFSGLAYSMEK